MTKLSTKGMTVSKFELMRRALFVIESICAESSEPNLGKIYSLAHAARKPTCSNSHKDWERDIHKMYEQIKASE